jgi:murein L,D-transpeptidase YafK
MGMVHRSGNVELIRVSLVRALLASAVLAGALALAGCYGDDGYQLPTRAMKELSPEMLTLLEQKNMPKDSPILVRIFKEESELEVWKEDTTGRYELVKVYPICRWSGDLGPKVKEGDRQAPEGFYDITPGLMNPNSSYYLAINIGFPNAFDKANNRSGAFLMIHGDCSSRGCYAMTDEQIGEIYSLAREAFLGGQKAFQIQAYPFRMTPANLARHRNNPNLAFWKMIKEGNDHFEVSHTQPKVDVCERHYVFDATPPAGSSKPLVFTPTGRCPAFEVDPQIAGPATDKQRNDEYQIAQLISQNMPVAPLNTGTDGGMNRVFVAKLDNPTYTYDNEGHIHVPPLQEGRLPPAISPPRGSESYTTAAIAAPPSQPGSIGNAFSDLFASKANAQPSQVASAETDSPGHSGLFGNLFRSKSDAPPATAPSGPAPTATTATPKSKPVTHNEPVSIATLRPKPSADPHKSEPQVVDASKGKAKPQQQANATATPAGAGVMSGAQPVLPAGSFDTRWGGFQ